MKIFIASDHAAFNEKNLLIEHLKKTYDISDLGTYSTDSTDYPDWSKKIVKQVQAHNTVGILLCGSGIGVSMAANRYSGIRAALCRDEDDAKMSRLHNNANILCLSGKKTSPELLVKITDIFLNTSFEGGRHQVRLDKFNDLGE